eukprot:m.354402 g.354402  ORF g.354402 m.354402 type:complete len:988 (-) comp17009_c0_seq1:234-3197(-)
MFALQNVARRALVRTRHIAQHANVLAAMSVRKSSFLNGTGTNYVDAMYRSWQKDPESVHVSWRTYFANLAAGVSEDQAYVAPPSISGTAVNAPASTGAMSPSQELDAVKVERLIRAYEVRGHSLANLDPLGILNADLSGEVLPELTLEHYGFTEADLDRSFAVFPRPNFKDMPSVMKLRDIIDYLQNFYCSNTGYEFMFIQERERVMWLQEHVVKGKKDMSDEKRRQIMNDLVAAREFELFLQKKFVADKRFGVDGCEALIPGMRAMLRKGSELGVEYAVLGMPHRGRLNVLHNVMNKPVEVIFNEFTSNLSPDDEGSGDVKYHLGMSSDVTLDETGKTIHLTLMPNPSHLEAVNPVVAGKTRSEQDFVGSSQNVVPILLHGDAAFAGQGVVYETLGLSNLPAYTTNGTIHIIVNNQIGFTTDPRFSRSTPYCTDLAKMLGAPIFHVNGDDPEAVVRACRNAMEWRQRFNTDVVVDIVCFRRNGHNESDQPAFTQPLMYQHIDKHPSTDTIYYKKLEQDGVLDRPTFQAMQDAYNDGLNEAWKSAPDYTLPSNHNFDRRWGDVSYKITNTVQGATGVSMDKLKEIGQKISQAPEGFNVHRTLQKQLKSRSKAIDNGGPIDWATAEALAFGSLLTDDEKPVPVRLSGQDVERGTFSQRHHVLHDQKEDGLTHCALKNLSENQPTYTVSNSHLAEYAVLGFEWGYSSASPDQLVVWEAQFGDFANTAQCIIDQFIAAAEQKWHRQNGLVMLLPHGFEGMGPEHSNARPERFLQLCMESEDVYCDNMDKQLADCNMQVANCTTPANYFHILRRQVKRAYRKPLILMTPKSLLRLPACKSTLEDLGPDTAFQPFLPEAEPSIVGNADEVKRVIFCSGRVYYDLLERQTEENIQNVAIARVEQISPFPFQDVKNHLDQFPNADVVWCQEEPRNMGAWFYTKPRIETCFEESTHHKDATVKYVGRVSCSSVATGDKKIHKVEQERLIDDCFAI